MPNLTGAIGVLHLIKITVIPKHVTNIFCDLNMKLNMFDNCTPHKTGHILLVFVSVSVVGKTHEYLQLRATVADAPGAHFHT